MRKKLKVDIDGAKLKNLRKFLITSESLLPILKKHGRESKQSNWDALTRVKN